MLICGSLWLGEKKKMDAHWADPQHSADQTCGVEGIEDRERTHGNDEWLIRHMRERGIVGLGSQFVEVPSPK